MQRLSLELLLSLKTKGALQSAIDDPSKSKWRRLLVYTINMSVVLRWMNRWLTSGKLSIFGARK